MSVELRPMTEADVGPAEDICRLAFGTFFELPDPMEFRGDGALIRPRFLIDPTGALVAESDGEIVASGFVMNWGSVGIFGPLTVHPDHWSTGIGRRITAALVEILDEREHDFSGLLTHPQSTRHVRLYESVGFEVQRLVAVLRRATEDVIALPERVSLLSATPSRDERDARLKACQAVSETVYPGLDLTHEIRGVVEHGLGDAVLLERKDGAPGVAGFAVCHFGPGSEGNAEQLFVKAGAVETGENAAEDFDALLEGCEALASMLGAKAIAMGTNTGRREAYAALRMRGYESFMNAVAMLRPWGEGYGIPGIFAIDDWR